VIGGFTYIGWIKATGIALIGSTVVRNIIPASVVPHAGAKDAVTKARNEGR
jgi:hypothetical protein